MPTLFRARGGEGKPVWRADGQSLIVPDRNNQNHAILYGVDVKSGEVTTVVDTGGGHPNSAAVSPDGRTAYASSDACGGGRSPSAGSRDRIGDHRETSMVTMWSRSVRSAKSAGLRVYSGKPAATAVAAISKSNARRPRALRPDAATAA